MPRRREAIHLNTIRSSGSEHAPTPALTSINHDGSSEHLSVTASNQEENRGSDSNLSSLLDQSSYPEADRGRNAWLMLAGCSLVQLPIWGFTQAFGIFQEYYTNQDASLQGGKDGVPVIGATSNGVLYLLSPFVFSLLTKFPTFRPYCGVLGLILTVAGFLASSFADQIWQLILTQGVLASIGCGLLFGPTTLYLDEWFINKKGLAYGVMWAGKSIVGVVIPFAAQGSLESFGFRVTMRAWATLVVLTTLPVLKFIKPRIPVSTESSGPRRTQLLEVNFLRMSSFWIFQCSNIAQGLGYFIPTTYLYSYATSTLGFSTSVGTIMTASVNASSTIGGIILGMLCDRYPVSNVILISSLGSALAIFVFWGLSSPLDANSSVNASSYALLTLFTIAYGFFAGGFSSTWSGILTHLKREAPGLESGLMFGLLAGGRGVGNVISGPVSAALLDKGSLIKISSNRPIWSPGYETQYGSVIVFSGVTALMAAGSWYWQKGRLLFK